MMTNVYCAGVLFPFSIPVAKYPNLNPIFYLRHTIARRKLQEEDGMRVVSGWEENSRPGKG